MKEMLKQAERNDNREGNNAAMCVLRVSPPSLPFTDRQPLTIFYLTTYLMSVYASMCGTIDANFQPICHGLCSYLRQTVY